MRREHGGREEVPDEREDETEEERGQYGALEQA
jgi:hypothetical protein